MKFRFCDPLTFNGLFKHTIFAHQAKSFEFEQNQSKHSLTWSLPAIFFLFLLTLVFTIHFSTFHFNSKLWHVSVCHFEQSFSPGLFIQVCLLSEFVPRIPKFATIFVIISFFSAQNICDISQRHFRQFEHFYINFVDYFRLLNWSFTFSFSFFLKRLLCKHFWLRAKNLEFRLVFRFSAWFHSISMFHVLLLLLLIYLPYSAVFGLRFSDFWYAEFCWEVCQKI